MKKSKVLGVVMSSALVASLAATAAISVSAKEITKSADILEHTVGVVGDFNGWDNDVALTDEDGDGVYEGIVEVGEVTSEMFTAWKVDDVPTGDNYLQFKVRLDGAWTDSWGAYEPGYDRTWNSQSNVPVKEAVVGEPLTFKVFFDIKNPDPAAVEMAKQDEDHYAEEGSDDYNYLHVWYEIVKAEEPSVEESSEEPSVAESSVESTVESSADTSTVSETPATESSTDTTTVPTGDTTSAVALAAVVVASLGVAVVMTKKASSKN